MTRYGLLFSKSTDDQTMVLGSKSENLHLELTVASFVTYRVVHSKQICVGTKSQDPMAICFTNRTKGAPTLVEYSQHGLTMRFSQASRYSPPTACTGLGNEGRISWDCRRGRTFPLSL